MAAMDHPPQPRDRNVRLLKTETLGSGSYGVVCKAMLGQRLCAAKLLHLIFFQSNDPGIVTTRRRFEQECRFLNDMKHPNIVEYLGTSHDPESGLLVLLMELGDESLTHFLERSQQSLAYHIEVDLCHDIAQALAYIHSKDIIHRDLSGNNVLLIAGKAKITDFGMSKLLDENRRMTPLTMCPGTTAYMPPEAFGSPPVYTKKIDCFAFGVLQIQIMTRQFPDPGPDMKVVEDSRSPTGTMKMPVLENERRKSHIDLINPTHALLPTALSCLSYLEKDRPSAEDLCRQLDTFKEAPSYSHSMQKAQLRELQEQNEAWVQAQQIHQQLQTLAQELQTQEQQLQNSQTHTHTLQQVLRDRQRRLDTLQRELQDRQSRMDTPQQELQDHQRRMDTLQQELQTKNQQLRDSQRCTDTLQQELQTKDQQLQVLQGQNQQLTHQVEEKQHTMDDRETQLRQLNQQLQANEQVTAEFQRNLLQHKQTNKQLQETVSQLRRDLQQAAEERQAGERQLRDLQSQLQTTKQAGAQTITPQLAAQPQDTITRPRQELQHAQQVEETQHVLSEGRERQLPKPTQQLQQMKRTAIQPQKSLMQQKTIRDMKWQKESKAPEKMWRGSAASDSNMAYFNGLDSTEVYSYDSDTHKWHRLPDTPHKDSTLVVVQHILTTVGGRPVGSKVTNSLLSLMGEGGAMKWLPLYPAMPTSRQNTAAVCNGHSLIVAGGWDHVDHRRLATVEVLDIDTKQWSTSCSLPHPFSRATISICGEQLYLMADNTHSVLTCSVHELLQCQTRTLLEKLHFRKASSKQTTKWRQIANTPHSGSSCATLCGQLVAVGGKDGNKKTAAIFGYNERTDSWEAMGDMPTARCSVLVAIVNGKLMAVGGYSWAGLGPDSDVVEILC